MKMMRSRDNNLCTAKCPICGKVFTRLTFNNYTYKLQLNGRTRFYCSYTCWRVDQKKDEGKRKNIIKG